MKEGEGRKTLKGISTRRTRKKGSLRGRTGGRGNTRNLPLEIRQSRVSAFLIIETKSTWLRGTNRGLGWDVGRLLESRWT